MQGKRVYLHICQAVGMVDQKPGFLVHAFPSIWINLRKSTVKAALNETHKIGSFSARLSIEVMS